MKWLILLKNQKCLYCACSGNALLTVVISTNETNFQIFLSLLLHKNSNAILKQKVPI